jgi:predicted TIM-barrel fold metal-dependent hydrolase
MLAITLTEDEGEKPIHKLPAGTCDTHSHIYGPESDYPYTEGREPRLAPVDAYIKMMERTGIARAVIVQPSLYGTDNRCTLDAIQAIGPARARGTAVVPADTPLAELKRLHDGGIRGIRISYNGDELSPETAHDVARMIADLGWVIQVQDSRPAWIADAAPLLGSLPVPLIFDHFGRTPAAEGVNSDEFKAMVKLLEAGNVWVKLSGPWFSSTDGAPDFEDMRERVRVLVDARPERLLFGLVWPFPFYSKTPNEGDAAHVLDLFAEWLPDENTRAMIMAGNAAKLYGFED